VSICGVDAHTGVRVIQKGNEVFVAGIPRCQGLARRAPNVGARIRDGPHNGRPRHGGVEVPQLADAMPTHPFVLRRDIAGEGLGPGFAEPAKRPQPGLRQLLTHFVFDCFDDVRNGLYGAHSGERLDGPDLNVEPVVPATA
jgi:hypothetical protein